jgi:hypothetical protein
MANYILTSTQILLTDGRVILSNTVLENTQFGWKVISGDCQGLTIQLSQVEIKKHSQVNNIIRTGESINIQNFDF